MVAVVTGAGGTRRGDGDLEALFTAENAIALATLTSLEIVLGIDNIVFIAVLTQKLPPERQPMARRLGLLGAMGMRIGLLLAIGWVMGLTATLFHVFEHSVAGRDLILLGGGLFLVAEATGRFTTSWKETSTSGARSQRFHWERFSFRSCFSTSYSHWIRSLRP